MILPIKHLASGGVITTYRCVSRCGHCLYNSSPARSGGYLDEPSATEVFRRIRALGCRSVHIGGGEPLLSPEKLIRVLSAAAKTGVPIDYVETNGAWFTNSERAEAVLASLMAAGAGTLLVSISPFHNAYIPWVRVKGLLQACRETGMAVFPWVNTFVRDLDRLDDQHPHAMSEFEAVFGPDYVKRILDRYWIHPGGRALDTYRPIFPPKTADQAVAASPPTCAQSLADTSHFHIDLYGNYIPGLCAGLALDMDDLGSGLPSGKYPLLECLSTGGIGGLLKFARREHAYVPRGAGYLNHCDLCTDIRRFLQQHAREVYPELAPVGFYEEMDQPARCP